MTERKPTNDRPKLIIETNNSYDITYGLKNYSQKDGNGNELKPSCALTKCS